MKAIYKWMCWDCKTIGELVSCEGEEITLTELLGKARSDTSRKYYEGTIYCQTCGEEKAKLTIPTGLNVAFAVDGRVSLLTTYDENDTDDHTYSL